MENRSQITVICVDIGMTRSAARWKASAAGMDGPWMRAFYDRKVPTMVAYDANGRDGLPLAWGDACVDLRPRIQIQECFKSSIGNDCLPNPNLELQNAGAQATPHRWMRDYMQLLFDEIITNIDAELGPSWKEAAIHWVFTVPGSWAEFQTAANFKRLAGDAVRLCIGERPASKIIINFTEAQASAYCLLKYGPAASIEGYSRGKNVLSCDIGGATTDIAVSQIRAPGLLKTLMQLDMHPVGMADISKQFRLHIQQTLENAGVANPVGKAWDVARVDFLRVFIEGGPQLNDRIAIDVPGDCLAWRPPGNSPHGTMIVEKGASRIGLLIHKDTLAEMFTGFLNAIETTIDLVINNLAKEDKQLDVIGFCGGGSQMIYPIQRLRRRYEDKIRILDHRDFTFQPEMATIIGSTFLYDQQTTINFCQQMHFGIKSEKDSVKWVPFTEVQTTSDFQAPYAMEVNFLEQTSSLRNSSKREVIAVPRTAARPLTFSAASLMAGSKIWRVKINLAQCQTPPASWTKKYQVNCKINGVWTVEIGATTGRRARKIDCTMI